MANKPPLVYLDSCILIAFLKNEKRTDPAEMQGVKRLMKHVDEGKLNMITSALTRAEILECTLQPSAQRKLEEVFLRKNVLVAETDHVIWQKTHDIRNFYKLQKQIDGRKVPSVPDAVHLATAIVYDAETFYTFDGTGSSSNARPLLSLSGNVAGHDLKIEKPLGELDLFSQVTIDTEAEDDED